MSAMTKPMYRKYYEVWSEHAAKYGSKVALLYQVGGFFELYDTENLTTGTTMANIREIAEICQLSLTVHAVEGTTDQQTLFGGFPEHAVGKFERILVAAGYTVVVVTQRKGRTGQVEERLVDHIASPGCYVEGGKERRLVGVVLESLSDGPAALRRVYWSATALDIATGHIWFVEGVDRDRLHQFLCIHPPAELVMWSDGGGAATHWMESLKTLCSAVHVRCLAPAAAAIEEATLEKLWCNSRRRLTWMHTQPQSRRCLASLMDFATDHVPSALRSIGIPEVWVPTGEVRLGNAALEQLGLLSLHGDDKQSLLGLMDQCRSVAGRRALRQRLLRPITDVATLNERLDRIDAAQRAAADPERVATTERGLRSLYDMSRLFRKLELDTATLGDVACLLRSYEAAATLMAAWGTGTPAMLEYLAWVSSVWDTAATTELAREGSVPVTGLPWVPGVKADVEARFNYGATIRASAVELCKTWSSLGRGEPLYLDDAEGGGFRITGTKRRIGAVHTSLRDGGDKSAIVSQYKASAILETATLTGISDAHRTWYQGWQGEWCLAWSAACAEIVARGALVHQEIEAWCADLDVSWTAGRLSAEWFWKRPEIVEEDEGSFVATKLRHPVIERIQTVPYVSHSVGFGTQDDPANDPTNDSVTWTGRGLLLYGMNASGKSSLMKAIGLCVVLAQCGFPVPAATCRISPFSAIFTRILGNDNLWAGMSSFAVEMTEFREILQYADERSIVLGDELCSGTESLSATALVAAGVEVLATRGTKFVFATHLHELATLPDIAGLSGVKSVHLRVHYDAATDHLVYDRHLAPGSGSALYGLEVCRALDLPVGYLDRATALRKSLAGWQGVHVSSYSTAVAVDRCGVCGSGDRLEVHHIRPQATAAVAAGEGFDIHAAGNLVTLCAKCHDEHHASRLVITGWIDTSAGRRLDFYRPATGSTAVSEEVAAWVRDQRRHRITIPTIQRMTKQLHGVDLTRAQVLAVGK
jgi:DNA mismatch repair protein MutS